MLDLRRERYLGQQLPIFVGGVPLLRDPSIPVLDKYHHRPFAEMSLAQAEDIEQAILRAKQVAPELRWLPVYQRRDILLSCAEAMVSQHEELAHILVLEVGKPIRDARVEVDRMIDTFRIAAAEVMTLHDSSFSLETSKRSMGYSARTQRLGVGLVLCITPFNFPFNLAAHKIAPAIATGCPFILKPSSQTPVSAWALGEILAQTALPMGAFSVLPSTRQLAEAMITDPRIAAVSFTGSPDVGWALKSRAGRKRVTLELGGNAAVLVDEGTEIKEIALRVARGAYSQAGQSCISVQRILVHESARDALVAALLAELQTWKLGDPAQEETQLGPMISAQECDRIQRWIAQAEAEGGHVVLRGNRAGTLLGPTLLENVDPKTPLYAKEAFAPVATIETFSTWSQAIQLANASEFGLQVGVFTESRRHADQAFRELECGGVVLNDVPTFRADNMPYGGMKSSGFGREGVRYAMEEMFELKCLVTRH